MYTDKEGIRILVQGLVNKGLKHVVLSPGSRNAPLSLTFHRHPELDVVIIPDERSAAYFALGMVQQLGQPVALCCTSGSAALNYYPAISEAFYQELPLLVITADRPVAWIDMADGQTIRQKNIYQNHIKSSFELPGECLHEDDKWLAERIASEAWDQSLLNGGGPVHINVPLREPLYRESDSELPNTRIIKTYEPEAVLKEGDWQELLEEWNGAEKKLILAGLNHPSAEMNFALNELGKRDDVVILTETTSNLEGDEFIPCIDKVITTVSEEEATAFQPDLLITFGGPVVSKKIKSFLRAHRPSAHWHISLSQLFLDTYQSLTANLPVDPDYFFVHLLAFTSNNKSEFRKTWKDRHKRTEELHTDYLQQCEFSDLKVFDHILASVPNESDLHLANSTPIRYAQLFVPKNSYTYFSNRGTSGIDGCSSTAAGSAYISKAPTTLITGDIGFYYDTNAFWNNYLSKDLRIILINNSGGSIFRIIDGPSNNEEIELLFETKQQVQAEHIALQHGLSYFKAENEHQLKDVLEIFYVDNGKPAILEVFTDNQKNPEVLKKYFDHLKKL